MTVQIQHTTFGTLLLFQSEREVNKNRKNRKGVVGKSMVLPPLPL